MKNLVTRAKASFKDAMQQHGSPSVSTPAAPGTIAPPVPPRPDDHPTSSHPSATTEAEASCTLSAPTPHDVLCYRYHHGTNLGSVFVLERWLTPSVFPSHIPSEQTSELAAVSASVTQHGLKATRERWERHWAEALSDEDVDWLVRVAKCTTIRLPIGHFTLGPAHCANTPFAPYAAVYTHALSFVTRLAHRLRAAGLSLLLDLHALPGGANRASHSGTDSGRAELWHCTASRHAATACAVALARHVAEGEFDAGIVGIGVVNEAEYDAPGLYEWYAEVVAAVRAADPGVPVYLSDAWDRGRAVEWAAGRNRVGGTGGTVARVVARNPVVVDAHAYWCFGALDRRKSPREVVHAVPRLLSPLERTRGGVVERSAAECVIGEYSCVLSEESWARKGAGESKEELVKAFGRAQSRAYPRATGGAFFWTFKMDWPPGGEWGFRAQTEQKNIIPPDALSLPAADVRTLLSRAESLRSTRGAAAVAAHAEYWGRVSSRRTFEHWRFEKGWHVGWGDAAAFFGMRVEDRLGAVDEAVDGADVIGLVECWCLKRIVESGMSGGNVWEFEHGLRRGIADFREVVGV